MEEQKNLVDGELGSDGSYAVSYKDGKMRIEAKYGANGVAAGAFVEADAVKLIDQITDAIPGEWDDAVIDGLAQKMLAKKTG